MQPVKVCFISFTAYGIFRPDKFRYFGGAHVQLYNFAIELAKDTQFKVDFVVGDFGQPDVETIENVRICKFSDFLCKFHGVKYIRSAIRVVHFWRFLKKLDADIYIQRSASVENLLLALFCSMNKKKYVYMVANDEDIRPQMPSYLAKDVASRLRRFLFKIGLNKADVIIVQSTIQKEELKKYYHKNGIIRNSAHIIRAEKEVLKECILWVGRAERLSKRPELFIKLAKALPSEKFVIICPVTGDQEYDKVFFDEIKNVALTLPNLKFIDYVPFNEIDDYFAKAKVFINTSKTEGFPNTFVQAAKNKTPILSLSVNPDGILEKYAMGKSFNGDFDGMKSFLTGLLNDSTLLDEMAENGYRYAKANHDLKKIVEEDKKWLIKLAKSI